MTGISYLSVRGTFCRSKLVPEPSASCSGTLLGHQLSLPPVPALPRHPSPTPHPGSPSSLPVETLHLRVALRTQVDLEGAEEAGGHLGQNHHHLQVER